MVLPKKPAIHTSKLGDVLNGTSHHSRRSADRAGPCPAVAHAAAARSAIAAAATGHHPGRTAHSSSASGSGLVKTCPT